MPATDDERTLYDALTQVQRRLGKAVSVKETEVREAFDQWLAGQSAGPTTHQFKEWDRLREMERLQQTQLDSLVAQIVNAAKPDTSL